ncbi:hypothetical protein ElyMa_002404700 [Elysia marginata]|uniref:Uncharacterized protein n=1 Tax=Elysia marginata TaxID=1093978 RepID=A0AAV4GFA4_9GAST|nr:hypothetical protein ElyMa_002404700 [Elysia marginata]
MNRPDTVPSHREINPDIYQAEFIRKLVKDELWEIQEWMREWFWSFRSEQIKASMRLERIEALLADSVINPDLFEEIAHLKEENARLRKAF